MFPVRQRRAAWARCGLAAALLLTSLPGSAANEFGVVELAEGRVYVINAAGSVSTPKTGDRIYEGSTLGTGNDGELHVATADSGLVALRPNTRLRVDEYQADGEDDDHQALYLLRGTFRALSGWIGRDQPRNYSVTTPTAVIGIRGTDHEPAYWPDAVGEDAVGTYDRVNEGRTFIRSEAGELELGPEQTGFVGKRKAKPKRLAAKPRFYRGGKHEKRILEKRKTLKQRMDKRKHERREKHRAQGQKKSKGKKDGSNKRKRQKGPR